MSRRRTHILAMAAAISVSTLQAATSNWIGGTDTSWNTPTNWDNGIPDDVANFTNTGASGTISLGVPQTIHTLTYNATSPFTIGAAGETLTLTNVTRNDVSGTEGNHVIASGVALSSNSVWTVNGSGVLEARGGISGGYSLTKRGTGTLTISTADSSYSGGTVVEQGTLNINKVIPTPSGMPLVVGGAGFSATAVIGAGQVVNRFTVNAGGTVNQGAQVLYPVSVVVAGGTWNAGQIYTSNNQSFTLRDGGRVTGGWGMQNWSYAGSFNVSTGSTATCRWETAIRVGNNYTAPFNIGEGDSPIDVIISASITGTATSALSKNGLGVMQLTSNGNTFTRPVSVTAGTLLVDNTDLSKSGTGQGIVMVSGGATLGGAGSIGGGYATSAVTLSNGSASSRATIAPGSIDNTSGDALVGTLTVGTATQSNNVTFGSYAQLLAQVGNAGSNDRLSIFGDLNLAAANDLLALQQVAGSTPAGDYTLASFTGTLTGRFDSVTFNGGSLGGYEIQYRNATGQIVSTADPITGGSIVLAIPEPGSMTLAAGALGFIVVRRRRVN